MLSANVGLQLALKYLDYIVLPNQIYAPKEKVNVGRLPLRSSLKNVLSLQIVASVHNAFLVIIQPIVYHVSVVY